MAPSERVIELLRVAHGGAVFEEKNLVLLRAARYGNADVYRYSDGERDLIVKDFVRCVWWFRWTLGKYYVWRECGMMELLKGVRGIAEEGKKLDRYAFCYRRVEGKSLADVWNAKEKLPAEFFLKWEKLTEEVTARGVAHLDSRNMGNVLCDTEGQPHLIDFQSAMRLRWFPRFVQRLMVRTDFSAVYKGWRRLGEGGLPEDKAAVLDEFNKLRKFWVLKGYPTKHLRRWFDKTFRGRK